MRLTPVEIRQQRFCRRLMGVDPTEVLAFLEGVAQDVETMHRELAQLRAQVQARHADIADFRERERSLRDAMMAAARVSDDMKENARREAELIIARAETEATRLIQDAQTQLVQIAGDITEMRREQQRLEAARGRGTGPLPPPAPSSSMNQKKPMSNPERMT